MQEFAECHGKPVDITKYGEDAVKATAKCYHFKIAGIRPVINLDIFAYFVNVAAAVQLHRHTRHESNGPFCMID